MDPGVIANLRRGQARFRDDRLAGLLAQRGLIGESDTTQLTADMEPGGLGARLVAAGRLSDDQLSGISRELDLLEELDTQVGDLTPPEVRKAAREHGIQVGKYVLVEKLGAGGMGVVWRAWDNALARFVAVKLLKVQDQKLIRRFMREATLLGRLSHPNITRVYEVGIHDQKPFLAMELADGGNLAGKTLERQAAAEVIRDAARAVAYAHAQGIVHRDLKPSNLLTDSSGRIFVTDFGLARLMEEGASMTASGALLGTPSYMAPEQAEGRDADGRTDVYGLGATLFALVTGEPPFSGEAAAEIVRRVAVSVAPTLPGGDDLSVIAEKAMERERQDRYQTPEELADDLDRFLTDEPILARHVSSLERAWRKVRRRPVASGSVAAAALLVLGLSAWGADRWNDWRLRSAAEHRAESVLAEAEAVEGNYRMLVAGGRADSPPARRALDDLETLAGEALTEAPDYPPALLVLGLTQRRKQRLDDAEATFSRILELDPDNETARYQRGLARFFKAEPPWPLATATSTGMTFDRVPMSAESEAGMAEARDDLEALAEDHPQRPYGEALLAFADGDWGTSAALLRDVVQSDSHEIEAWRHLGWSELALGNFGEAEAIADRLLDYGVYEGTGYHLRAYARGAQGRFEEALADAAKALELEPGETPLVNFSAYWLLQLARLEESLAKYDQLVTEEPREVEYLLGRSLVHSALGDREAAQADAERALELEPDNPSALYHKAIALGPSPEAVALLDRALEIEPDDATTVGQRAMMHFQLDGYEEAVRDARRAMELEPEVAYWRWWLGMSLFFTGEYEEAERQLTAAVDGGLSSAFTLAYRGFARIELGRCESGIADLGRADAIEPTVTEESWQQVRDDCGDEIVQRVRAGG